MIFKHLSVWIGGFALVPILSAGVAVAVGTWDAEGHYAPSGHMPAWPTPDPAVESMVFPERFDWREHGGYTTARNQGSEPGCYPCWAFSLIGAAESAFKIATGLDCDLSEQQLLDCNTNGYGCDGGFVDGWTALRDYGAVPDDCYPFVATDGECSQMSCTPAGWIIGVYPVPYSMKSIKYALINHGALSCSMTVYNNFMSYSGGCYEHADTQPINHGVVIVGWDDAMCDGQGAWFVKNSWGTGWGDAGVAYMKYETCKIGRHAQWFEYSASPPGPGLHYGLHMPDTELAAGDRFVLERRFGNPSDDKMHCIEMLILDVYGEYWFYPGFTQDIEWTARTVPGKGYGYDILLSFDWPEQSGGLTGIRFWGGFLDPETLELLDWDMAEWNS